MYDWTVHCVCVCGGGGGGVGTRHPLEYPNDIFSPCGTFFLLMEPFLLMGPFLNMGALILLMREWVFFRIAPPPLQKISAGAHAVSITLGGGGAI